MFPMGMLRSATSLRSEGGGVFCAMLVGMDAPKVHVETLPQKIIATTEFLRARRDELRDMRRDGQLPDGVQWFDALKVAVDAQMSDIVSELVRQEK